MVFAVVKVLESALSAPLAVVAKENLTRREAIGELFHLNLGTLPGSPIQLCLVDLVEMSQAAADYPQTRPAAYPGAALSNAPTKAARIESHLPVTVC